LSDAIRSIGKSGTLVNLEAPATAENILKAISLVSSDEI
jgi:xanthine dehydrogenase molybdopterin-binding subunit B